jgi:putative redox protein
MRIDVDFPGGLRVDASFGGFLVRTDQPSPVGEGSAPSPFELFLASLATCAGIYVLSFCRERNIPTEGLRLVQSAKRDPGTGKLSGIELEIGLPEGFPEKFRHAVGRAAELCAVKRTMEDPPLFSVVTVEAVSRVGAGPGTGV